MDYATLKAFEPTGFEGAADGYRALGNAAQAARNHIENTVATGMRTSLSGESAEAAQKQLKALAENFHYTVTECHVISTALNGFAYDMAAAKRKLDAAVEDARADGCTVNADGSVSYPAGRKPGDEKDTEGARSPAAPAATRPPTPWSAKRRTSTRTPTTARRWRTPTGSPTRSRRPRTPTPSGNRRYGPSGPTTT
ncbi:hypothetical protein RGF97_28730 [Streptomyces roseicoloratus]|uniref:Uncharacterized protein n=1 Tax=Streptomyces roseicoloratus TaxID=2508722 RepID=A0ABY9S4S7_9ACTN|nr:hypothetical protein [Streptomyces roseicoloratus]WMX48000.1 hypothetical protein RGF97_28730 [Streptomyces roseicoloratus]